MSALALLLLLCWRIISHHHHRRRREQERRRLRDQPTELQRWAAEHWHPRL